MSVFTYAASAAAASRRARFIVLAASSHRSKNRNDALYRNASSAAVSNFIIASRFGTRFTVASALHALVATRSARHSACIFPGSTSSASRANHFH
jgi:hypothetical protein